MTSNPAHRHLRHATADAHARVDAVVGGSLDSVGGYAAYLRGMHRFIAASAEALPAGSQHVVLAPRAWLEADLAALELRPIEAFPVPPMAGDRAAQLGWEYVVTGASVGARYLLRGAQALGFAAGRGASFLDGHARSRAWPDFLATLEQEALAGPLLERASHTAQLAFETAERAFTTARREATR